MTLEEYKKVFEEKRKALLAMKTEERKVEVDKELKSMQLLSNKKGNDDIFIKLVSHFFPLTSSPYVSYSFILMSRVTILVIFVQGYEKDKRKDSEKEEKAKKVCVFHFPPFFQLLTITLKSVFHILCTLAMEKPIY